MVPAESGARPDEYCSDSPATAREAIDFLTTQKQLSPDEAYALASVAVDFRITQVVDGTKGVHGMMPKAIFTKK